MRRSWGKLALARAWSVAMTLVLAVSAVGLHACSGKSEPGSNDVARDSVKAMDTLTESLETARGDCAAIAKALKAWEAQRTKLERVKRLPESVSSKEGEQSTERMVKALEGLEDKLLECGEDETFLAIMEGK